MKLGRLPRKHNPRVPHLSALRALRSQRTVAFPPMMDYTAGLPADLGMYGNDSLGDCTCAALYHALQVWTRSATGTCDSEPQQNAVTLYEEACGYNPSDPKTDGGGVEQDVLSFAMLEGIPVGNGSQRHQIAAFVEIDPRNFDDVKLAIATGGLVYLGFEFPDYVMSSGDTWDVKPSPDYQITGGHAVIAAGYTSEALKVISWGKVYEMTWAFWSEFVDEAYMLADKDWITSTGLAVCGLSLPQIEAQMAGIREEPQ